MIDEIYYGLKNALERGQSLNSAVQSFINAGYNPAEVRGAEKMISSDGGASSISAGMTESNAPIPNKSFQEQKAQPLPKSGLQLKSSGNWKKVLLIILIIILILVILGAAGFLIYTLLP